MPTPHFSIFTLFHFDIFLTNSWSSSTPNTSIVGGMSMVNRVFSVLSTFRLDWKLGMLCNFFSFDNNYLFAIDFRKLRQKCTTKWKDFVWQIPFLHAQQWWELLNKCLLVQHIPIVLTMKRRQPEYRIWFQLIWHVAVDYYVMWMHNIQNHILLYERIIMCISQWDNFLLPPPTVNRHRVYIKLNLVRDPYLLIYCIQYELWIVNFEYMNIPIFNAQCSSTYELYRCCYTNVGLSDLIPFCETGQLSSGSLG